MSLLFVDILPFIYYTESSYYRRNTGKYNSGAGSGRMDSFFTNDIKKLNTLYNRVQFSFIFLYGRYGTGKTSLIREFCRDKATLFFSAQETVPEGQLNAFYSQASLCLNPRKMPEAFEDWEQAFSFVSDYSFSRRLVVVLDEFQNLARSCPDFMGAFTQAVHHDFPAGRVFLIVSSSSVGYAGELMEEPIREPFDAITARAFLDVLPFSACRSLFSDYTPKEQLLLYGVTGGFPSCAPRIQPKLSVRQNIQALFFSPDSPLLTAPLRALHRELREISTYHFLLEIIASGCTKLTDIAERASVGTNKCAKYLGVLISLGLIRKEFPATGESMKKVRYQFADHMTRFWYRFVGPNLSEILFGHGQQVYEQQVLPALDEYLLPVFEAVCAEYLERLAGSGQTPFVYKHTGAWWTGGTKREPFLRIPLVAANEEQAVLGICHSAAQPAGRELLERLLLPIDAFGKRKRYCCIFSTSGFTEELRLAARETGNVWLIDLDDICG